MERSKESMPPDGRNESDGNLVMASISGESRPGSRARQSGSNLDLIGLKQRRERQEPRGGRR